MNKEDDNQLNKDEKLEQACVVKSSLQTPKLLETVIKVQKQSSTILETYLCFAQVIDPTTETAKKLMRSVSRAPEFSITREDEMFSEISSVAEDNSDCFNNWQHEMDLENDGALVTLF